MIYFKEDNPAPGNEYVIVLSANADLIGRLKEKKERLDQQLKTQDSEIEKKLKEKGEVTAEEFKEGNPVPKIYAQFILENLLSEGIVNFEQIRAGLISLYGCIINFEYTDSFSKIKEYCEDPENNSLDF